MREVKGRAGWLVVYSHEQSRRMKFTNAILRKCAAAFCRCDQTSLCKINDQSGADQYVFCPVTSRSTAEWRSNCTIMDKSSEETQQRAQINNENCYTSWKKSAELRVGA